MKKDRRRIGSVLWMGLNIMNNELGSNLSKEFMEFWVRLWVHRDFEQWQEDVFQHFLEVLHNIFRLVDITRIK